MQNNRGFTLIEVAIVLIIGGILLATSSTLLMTYIKKVELNTTKDRIEAINEALQLYLNLNGRYPCPALQTDQLDTATFGIENPVGGVACAGAVTAGRGGRNVIFGAVPVRTLNLPDSFIADSWGGRFTYSVTKSLAETGTYNRTQGAIFVIDSNNNNVVTNPDPLTAGNPLEQGVAHYTIVSHGENNLGAFSLEGVNIAACPAIAVQEAENCNNDATFRSTMLSSQAAGVNFNDDLVAFKSITSFGAEIPAGAVIAFRLNACPTGWVAFTSASGRFVIGSGANPTTATAYNLEATGDIEEVTLNNLQVGFRIAPSGINAPADPAGIPYAESTGAGATPHRIIPPYISLLYCEKS